MKTKFLYIDDETTDVTTGLIKKLSSCLESFEVVYKRAIPWDLLIDYIKDNIHSYDGILLDLKLEFDNEDQEGTIKFYASALANEIRSLIKRKEIKRDVPILLCSTDDNMRKLLDGTGKNEFDASFDKEKLKESDVVYFIAHSNAYKLLSNISNLEKLLEINEENNDLLEEALLYFYRIPSIHEKAAFLLCEVIEPSGILIDEELLSVRLGIDKSKCEHEWNRFLNEELKQIQYTGIYSSAYPRWWMRKLFQWWNEKTQNTKPLQLLNAEERVEKIKTLGYPDLIAYSQIPHQNSTKFWYKCANYLLNNDFTKQLIPVSDGDGLACLPKQYPWQDRELFSFNYIWEEGSKEVIPFIKKELATYALQELNTLLEKRAES